MTTITRRNEMLSTLQLDSNRDPVTDDLGGLERLVPEAPTRMEALAIFRDQLPPLLALRGRGQAHTIQVQRFIKMIRLEPKLAAEWIDVANAMTVLTNASHLALILLPVRSNDDAWTREQFGRHLLRRAREQGDGEDRALALRAIGPLPKPALDILPSSPDAIREMIETMARRAASLLPEPNATVEPGAPSVHTLEQADSLKAFFAAPPDLADLLGKAASLLALVDQMREDARDADDAGAAIEGGLVLAYAKLLRIALWPSRAEADVAVKIATRRLIHSRDADPDRLVALWEIALGQGETIAGQSSRFLRIAEQG